MSLPPAQPGQKAEANNAQPTTRARAGSLGSAPNASTEQTNQTLKPEAAATSSPQTAKTHARKSSGTANDMDPYSASHIYYGASHSKRNVAKARTYSAVSFTCHFDAP